MITATIGKIFLEAYNKKNGTKYDAKTFFVEVYHPLFFGSNKYLQWVQNSPFVQGLEKSSSGEFGVCDLIKDNEGKAKSFKDKEELNSYLKLVYADDFLEVKYSTLRKVKVLLKINQNQVRRMLEVFLLKVNETKKPDASIAPGFAASEEKEFATTSGQVSNLNIQLDKDVIFLSWIGSSLSINVEGGAILFTNPRILLDLFEGWKLYRNILNETNKMKGNQVNAWNGQWLAYRYSKAYQSPQHMLAFNNNSLFVSSNDGISIATISWTKFLIKLSYYLDIKSIIGYIYGFDPKKKLPITIGFIPIDLNNIRRPFDLYHKFFGMDNEGNKAEELWGTEYGLKESCKLGVIGLHAMQPKGLKRYMAADKDKSVRLPKLDNNQTIFFHTYQIWLLAMLNNEELWTKSLEFAKTLQTFVNNDKKLSTNRENIVNNILAATSKKAFIQALSGIAGDIDSFNEIEDNAKVVHMMPNDNVPYYLTLIRFHYAGINNKNQK